MINICQNCGQQENTGNIVSLIWINGQLMRLCTMCAFSIRQQQEQIFIYTDNRTEDKNANQ